VNGVKEGGEKIIRPRRGRSEGEKGEKGARPMTLNEVNVVGEKRELSLVHLQKKKKR